jgi:hypothetical protein
MTEMDELVARFSTPRDQLAPEARERLDALDARVAGLVAEGKIAAPHPLLDDDTAPGLDETNGYRPFWSDRPVD